jgi:hypothetical protein
VYANGGYAGYKPKATLRGRGDWTLKIIKVPTPLKGSEFCRVDGRANIRMARAMPQVGYGLRAIAGKLNGLDPDRRRQAHDTGARKLLPFHINFEASSQAGRAPVPQFRHLAGLKT